MPEATVLELRAQMLPLTRRDAAVLFSPPPGVDAPAPVADDSDPILLAAELEESLLRDDSDEVIDDDVSGGGVPTDEPAHVISTSARKLDFECWLT